MTATEVRSGRLGGTATGTGAAAQAPPSQTETPVPQPRLRSRRNPKWIALGIAALCLGALGSYVLYSDLAKSQTVVAVAATVYRGSLIEAADLTTVTVGSTPGIRTVPAADLDVLVGQRAAVDLVAGSLVPADAVSAAALPAQERAVVGISLVAGRAPEGFLTPGSPVRLVALPPDGAEPGYRDTYTNLAILARVVDTSPTADEMATLLNVDVAADQATTVGVLAAQNRLVVVRDAES